MDIFNVNIYIETSARGPAVREAAGEWIVEFITTNGIPVTRNGVIYKNRTTENALALELLRDAFSILTKTCSVRVNTECGHILNTMHNHWLPQWRKNGWMNAKDKPVANQKLWEQVSDLMDNHCIEFTSGYHSYRNVMQEDINRKLKQMGKDISAN